MRLYCPDGHCWVEPPAGVDTDKLTCATCQKPLTTLAPFQKTCHPEFGCSCVDVTQLEVKEGQVLVVTSPDMTADRAARVRDAFTKALHDATGRVVPVLVGPPLDLTVIAAEDA